MRWCVVMPVKRLTLAKSRLRGALPGVPHDRLVLALVRDTLTAALACPAVADVVVVTDGRRVAEVAGALGARVLPEHPDGLNTARVGASEHPDGLNTAIMAGASASGDRPVVALAGDLPALRPAELTAALTDGGALGQRFFVADAAGTGTTLLAAPAGMPLDPRFGLASAATHHGSGALRLPGDWPSLRRDVDTAADLAAARRLGLGQHTMALYARVEPAEGAGGRAGAGRYGRPMQATVATFDPEQRSGTVLLDDGTALAFTAPAFDTSGLRLLRVGQRVRLDQRDGEVCGLGLITMPS